MLPFEEPEPEPEPELEPEPEPEEEEPDEPVPWLLEEAVVCEPLLPLPLPLPLPGVQLGTTVGARELNLGHWDRAELRAALFWTYHELNWLS